MLQAATPLSSQSPQAQAATPGPQSAPAPATPAPAAPLDLRQLFWDVATLAFGLLTRLYHVLQPVQARYPKQAWQLARLFIDLPRIFLTIRYAPERVTLTQLRHLHRARHILQVLFNYTLPTPLGARTSRPPHATANQHPTSSPSTQSLGPRTPSSATPANTSSPSPTVPAVREVPEVPMVPGISTPKTPSATPSHTQSPSPEAPSPAPTLDLGHLTSAPSHPSQSPHSAFSPYIPDFHTLAQALKASSLPPNCAGALFDEPGDALVKALQQLHAVYFSLYPTQSPSPSPSPSPSQSPSSANLQSAISNPQSPSVHLVNNVNNVNNVHPVHSPSPHSSYSSYSSHSSQIPHSDSPIPHSTAPP